jgi:hypothetical protein
MLRPRQASLTHITSANNHYQTNISLSPATRRLHPSCGSRAKRSPVLRHRRRVALVDLAPKHGTRLHQRHRVESRRSVGWVVRHGIVTTGVTIAALPYAIRRRVA